MHVIFELTIISGLKSYIHRLGLVAKALGEIPLLLSLEYIVFPDQKEIKAVSMNHCIWLNL